MSEPDRIAAEELAHDRTLEALEQKAAMIDSRHKDQFVDLWIQGWMADEFGLLCELRDLVPFKLFRDLMAECNSGTGKTEALAAMNDALRNQAKKIAEAEWEEERARLMRDVY